MDYGTGKTFLVQNERNRFLAEEFFMLSWEAASEHNKIFKFSTEEELSQLNNQEPQSYETFIKQKEQFMPDVKEFTEKIRKDLNLNNKKSVSKVLFDKNNNEYLKQYIAEPGEVSFATSQKLLNMMCKYYWCIGWIYEPPHLPIDKINLSKLPKNKILVSNGKDEKTPDNISWTTDIITKNDYENIISEFVKLAEAQGYKSLAIWELYSWERKYTQDK
ncbi:MAG: hypothetical protein K6A43_05135 [Treponema sp.]|nr:hypothetical protein [Treponema sp.]